MPHPQQYIPFRIFAAVLIVLLVSLGGCSPQANQEDDRRLKVVATTTIVGDVVSQVGGELIDLTVLLPINSDPHSFDPTPQDAAAVAEADLIFANGLGLETFLDPLLENTGQEAQVVRISEGIELLTLEEGHEHEAEEEQEHGEVDPHVWFDPNNVLIWTDNISAALSEADPANKSEYTGRAQAYNQQLRELHTWIQEQVAHVPDGNRELVTDHTSLGHFAAQYSFEQIGAVFPGLSTLSEPSAQALAALEEAIRQFEVPAIFVGTTVSASMAQRVAQDTGIQVVPLYTGSLSEPDGPAGSYLDLMRYDVDAIVSALR